MESMRLPALPMGLHPSITRTPASTPGRPPGQPCHKGTNLSIARTSPAVAYHATMPEPGASERNLHQALNLDKLRRSIPAPAGEPPDFAPGDGVGQVYPRACGGTLCRATLSTTITGLSPRLRGNQRSEDIADDYRQGLSPRLRGNLVAEHVMWVMCRSIPAPAGDTNSLTNAEARCDAP